MPPGQKTALALSGLVLLLYAWFVASGAGQELYEWSKSFAPYSVRRYLSMSKRYLLQYGHIVFLFSLLVLSRYIFTSQNSLLTTGRATAFMSRYSTAVFLFHFPFMFCLAAVTPYDRTNAWHQGALLISTIGASLLLGRLCFAIKPGFDRWRKRALAGADRRFPRPPEVRIDAHPLDITQSHSEFLDQAKTFSMICIVLGHFSFERLSTFHMPGFDGAAPRFAVPLFFMVSGYFLMLSIDRSRTGAVALIGKRALSLYYLIVPMLIVTVILDNLGFRAEAELYNYSDYYFQEEPRRPYTLFQVVVTSLSSLAFLNESWWFTLIAIERETGGMRAFSNDPYWFMCYLIPFSTVLIVARMVPARRRNVILALWLLVYGIPILLLAPLFFAGSLAYFIHKRWERLDAS